MYYFLLDLIPGLNNTIPGIQKDYIPEEGAAAAALLFEKTYNDAWIIFGLLTVISLIFSVIGLGEHWNIKQSLKRIASVALLLVAFKFVFGGIFITNYALSVHIFSEDNVSELNQQFEKIATQEQESKGVADDKSTTIIGKIFDMINQVNADIATGIVSAIIAFVFFISATLMHMLWRIATIILYVSGPILIVFSLAPGFGLRILTGWFGATFQVAFWQVWFAICAYFVQTSDKILTITVLDSKARTANHIESVVFALVFTILFIGTPIIVNILLPISAFSAGLAGALRFGGFPIQAAVGAAGTVASAGAKAGLFGAGVLGKLFSRDGGTGSASSGAGVKPPIDGGGKPGVDKGTSDAGAIVGGRGFSKSDSDGVQSRRSERYARGVGRSGGNSGGGSPVGVDNGSGGSFGSSGGGDSSPVGVDSGSSGTSFRSSEGSSNRGARFSKRAESRGSGDNSTGVDSGSGGSFASGNDSGSSFRSSGRDRSSRRKPTQDDANT